MSIRGFGRANCATCREVGTTMMSKQRRCAVSRAPLAGRQREASDDVRDDDEPVRVGEYA